jgi:hypothetical protein
MSPRQVSLLAGRKLEYVGLDHVIVLGFSGGCQVLIESAAVVAGPDGRAVAEPGAPSADVFATLLGAVVRTAHTRDTGELEISLSGGREVLVCVDTDFESWAVAGPDGFLIVCLAHGELAVWHEERG